MLRLCVREGVSEREGDRLPVKDAVCVCDTVPHAVVVTLSVPEDDRELDGLSVGDDDAPAREGVGVRDTVRENVREGEGEEEKDTPSIVPVAMREGEKEMGPVAETEGDAVTDADTEFVAVPHADTLIVPEATPPVTDATTENDDTTVAVTVTESDDDLDAHIDGDGTGERVSNPDTEVDGDGVGFWSVGVTSGESETATDGELERLAVSDCVTDDDGDAPMDGDGTGEGVSDPDTEVDGDGVGFWGVGVTGAVGELGAMDGVPAADAVPAA